MVAEDPAILFIVEGPCLILIEVKASIFNYRCEIQLFRKHIA